MPDLTGREIFAVGKWNGMEFSETDLDDIVENFGHLSEIHKVPLKFGHNDEQTITDGQPAIGWVKRVYRDGKKLLADFADVPKTVINAIKNKLYRSVSVELLFDVDHNGSKFNHVLDAVALLGAEHPAVNTLADLDALLASRTAFSGGRRLCFEAIAGTKDQNLSGGISMDDKALNAAIAEAVRDAVKDAVAQYEDKLEVVAKERDDFKRKAEDAERKQADFERQQKDEKIKEVRSSITDLLDRAVREKHMTPAMREIYAKQIGVDDDERVLGIDVEQVRLMCKVEKKADDSKNNARNVTDELSGDPQQDLTTLTFAFMAEHNERDFSRALTAVARANPKLHREYLDSNVEG